MDKVRIKKSSDSLLREKPLIFDQTCQTSNPIPLYLTKDDIEDDIVLEAIIDETDQIPAQISMFDDNLPNPTVKAATGNVVNELKSVLSVQNNPGRRQGRKEALFPEYWESRVPESIDAILPEANSFNFTE